MQRKSCSFIADFNVPGKPNPWPIDLTATVWTLSHSVHMEKHIGQTVNCTSPEDGKYHPAEITKKHSDGTYDVYFFNDELAVGRVDPNDFEPIKGTSSTHVFAHALTHSLSRSLVFHTRTHPPSRKICDRVHRPA